MLPVITLLAVATFLVPEGAISVVYFLMTSAFIIACVGANFFAFGPVWERFKGSEASFAKQLWIMSPRVLLVIPYIMVPMAAAGLVAFIRWG
ncbi:hypothetical protein HK107_15400 [Parvularcula sp. ZS-1/3]|uniref:Uncharacterized protein n=1 Tax=Parvularcula mediterranea TaxID=2732508 RepID=A0A7Y3RP65_9PROT|nr:hypothetical protein [Parvularcula mediterranea]NNU17716.1 hypothetical protein [Parvularcula mediterranea]